MRRPIGTPATSTSVEVLGAVRGHAGVQARVLVQVLQQFAQGWASGYPAGYYNRAYAPNTKSTGAEWSQGYAQAFFVRHHDRAAGRPYDPTVGRTVQGR